MAVNEYSIAMADSDSRIFRSVLRTYGELESVTVKIARVKADYEKHVEELERINYSIRTAENPFDFEKKEKLKLLAAFSADRLSSTEQDKQRLLEKLAHRAGIVQERGFFVVEFLKEVSQAEKMIGEGPVLPMSLRIHPSVSTDLQEMWVEIKTSPFTLLANHIH